jgi:hypothetical protein
LGLTDVTSQVVDGLNNANPNRTWTKPWMILLMSLVAGVDTTDTENASGEVNDTVGGVDTTDTGNASGEVNATSTVGDITKSSTALDPDWGVPLTTLLVASLEIFKMLFKTFVTRFSINFNIQAAPNVNSIL